MQVYPLFRNSGFTPEQIEMMSAIFEDVCHDLGLSPREDEIRDAVARVIIDCSHRGVHDPGKIRLCAEETLRKGS